MTLRYTLGALVALLMAFAPTASAQSPYTAALSGDNEVPAVATTASGVTIATVASDGVTVTITGSFEGLTGDYAASHIHMGAAGSNGGVIYALTATTDADNRGGSWEAANNTFTFSAGEIASLETNGLYINVHSAASPSGEIRGQLSSQVRFPVTFEEDTDFELVDFEPGGVDGPTSMVVTDPTDGSNLVVQTDRPATAVCYAGTTLASSTGFTEPIPFAPGATTMSIRVWSPEAGIRVRLKAENLDDPTVSVETDAFTTVAMQWETLVFDFDNEVAGTAAINFASEYTKASIFFDFQCGVPGAAPADRSYFWDDVAFGDGMTGGAPIALPVSFEDAIDYELADFEPGGVAGPTSMVVTDPTDGSNMVVQTVRPSTAVCYAGTTLASTTGFAEPIPFAPGATTMSIRVWSPEAGIRVRLKAENLSDAGVSVETDAFTTVAMQWETLVFDFDNEVAGTAAINFASEYTKASIFFDFQCGVPGAAPADRTYYWDDVAFGDGMTGGSPDQALIITGVVDGPLSGGTPKAVELYVASDIADLSQYAVGSANNGGGTDGPEIALSGSASAGDFIYITDDNAGFNAFFGFDADFDASTTANSFAVSVNGDDAVELFYDAAGFPADTGTYTGTPTVVDTFGDINTDGSGQPWEYLDGWVYRMNMTGPDGSTFVPASWSYSGVDALDGESANATAANPFPVGSYMLTTGGGGVDPVVAFTVDNATRIEGSSAVMTVSLTFPDGMPNNMPVTVTVASTGGSAGDDDITGPTPATLVFSGMTDGETQSTTVQIVEGDGDEPQESVAFGISVTDGAATIGSPDTFVLTINDTDAPVIVSLADARAAGPDAFVTVVGVVTRSEGDFTYVQDDSGALAIRQTDGAFFDDVASDAIMPGSRVRLSGTLSEFRGLLQINGQDLDSYFVASAVPVPAAQVVTLSELASNGEAYESELVTVQEVTIDNLGGADFEERTTYPISDASDATGAVTLRTPNADDTTADGTSIPPRANITAIVGQFTSTEPNVGYQLLLIQEDDVDPLSAVSEENGPDADGPWVTVANPLRGSVTVTFSTGTPGEGSVALYDALGRRVATIAQGSLSGSAQTATFDAGSLASGVYVLRLDGAGGSMSRTLTVVR